MQPLADQILAFVMILLLGIGLGIFFDFYRIIRRIWRLKKWGTILGDAVFWLVSTVLAYGFLLLFNWGEVRLYVFLALAAGLALYLRYGSKTFSFWLLRFYLVSVQILVRLGKLCLLPFWLLWRIILMPCRLMAFFVVLVIKGIRRLRTISRAVLGRWPKRKKPPPPDAGC